MDLAPNTLDRIFAAADQLYAASANGDFPTVDTVRKLARANMSDVCSGMKEWRRRQSAHVDMVPIEVPAALQKAGAQSLQALWEQAIAVANEALRAAQASWQEERNESNIISEQTAAAFESLSRELDDKQEQLGARQTELAAAEQSLVAALQRAELLQHEHGIATASAERASALHGEVEQRAAGLERELERVYAALTQANNEAAEARRMAARELGAAHQALEQMRQQRSAQEAAARQQLAEAREQNAELRGAIAALQALPGRPRQRNKSGNTGADGIVPDSTTHRPAAG